MVLQFPVTFDYDEKVLVIKVKEVFLCTLKKIKYKEINLCQD